MIGTLKFKNIVTLLSVFFLVIFNSSAANARTVTVEYFWGGYTNKYDVTITEGFRYIQVDIMKYQPEDATSIRWTFYEVVGIYEAPHLAAGSEILNPIKGAITVFDSSNKATIVFDQLKPGTGYNIRTDLYFFNQEETDSGSPVYFFSFKTKAVESPAPSSGGGGSSALLPESVVSGHKVRITKNDAGESTIGVNLNKSLAGKTAKIYKVTKKGKQILLGEQRLGKNGKTSIKTKKSLRTGQKVRVQVDGKFRSTVTMP